MNIKLNKEAIDEIMTVLNEVKDVVRLLYEFNIDIDSDCWSATSPVNHEYEDILSWNRKHFETLDMTNIKSFTIGGNIITGSQHQYKDELIIAPKKLAKVQGEIFQKCLKSIIEKQSLKHFKLKFEDPYGLVDDCGWEHYMCINASVQESAIVDKDVETRNLINEIMNEEDNLIERSGCSLYDNNPKTNFHTNSGLVPSGDFPYMIEFFSHCIDSRENKYQGCYGLNNDYIKDVAEMINDIETRAKEIEKKYSNKGVKTTVNGFNDGCEDGMAIYVWIPYQ